MEPKTVIAIEIASSKIKGGAASVGRDGRISVLAVEELPGINNVRYGRIQNIREVSAAVNEIVRRLEKSALIAPRKIEGLTVSLGGRSLSATAAGATLRSPRECEITESLVHRLEVEAARDFTADKNIEAMVPRMYYVNNAAVRKAVGTFGETLRGDFMMVTCGRETRQNLERLKIENMHPDRIKAEIRPLATGDLVLSADEREIGCALVDFGAETTTVSVYKDGTLAFLSTLPMGSRLITLDLMAGLGITEEAAETAKLTSATMVEEADGEEAADDTNKYVRARAGEIAANIINQLQLSGYEAGQLSKIVLTGGGSKLPGFAEYVATQCKVPVRVATMPETITFRVAGRNNADNIDIVALLARAARGENCISSEGDVETVEDDNVMEFAADDQTFETVKEEPAEIPGHSDDDDDSILEDDEEDATGDEPPVRRSFFGLGRRKSERKDKSGSQGKADRKEWPEKSVVQDKSEEPEKGRQPEKAEPDSRFAPFTPDDDDDDGYSGGEAEGYSDDVADDHNYDRTKKIINKMTDRFISLFNTSVPEDDEEDENY